jgi:hypothetical protein
LADLSNEPYSELDKVAAVAYSMNEMTPEEIATLKKTLDKIATGTSSSVSPVTSTAP